MRSADDVSVTAITAVAGVSAGAARYLQSAALAASNGTNTGSGGNGSGDGDDGMAVVRAAASMMAVMQGPDIRNAIHGASKPGYSEGWSVLADMTDAEKLTAAVALAEKSVVIELPPPPPPLNPSPPPNPPPPHTPPSLQPESTMVAAVAIAGDLLVYVASGAAAVTILFVVSCISRCRQSRRGGGGEGGGGGEDGGLRGVFLDEDAPPATMTSSTHGDDGALPRAENLPSVVGDLVAAGSGVTVAQAARYPSLSAAPAAPADFAPDNCPSSSSASRPVSVSVSSGVPHLWPTGTVDTLRGGAGGFSGGVTLAPHTLARDGEGGGVTGC